MKTIGLLGGMSWESTSQYYRLLNTAINHKLGGLHSARIVMISLDFEPVEKLMRQGDWQSCGTLLTDAARRIATAGADILLICTNTMHKLAPVIQAAIPIPVVHICDAAAERVKRGGCRKVGLLGTRFTMEEDFYRSRLEHYGLHVLLPDDSDRQRVDHIIFNELCRGIVRAGSREEYIRIIDQLVGQGADGIILGCTEIAMLVQEEDISVPLYDTTAIHADKAVELALRVGGTFDT